VTRRFLNFSKDFPLYVKNCKALQSILKGAPIAYVFSAYFCNHYESYVEYNYPMTKVDWHAAGALLIPSSIGLVTDQKR
jgi:hypothetical protein